MLSSHTRIQIRNINPGLRDDQIDRIAKLVMPWAIAQHKACSRKRSYKTRKEAMRVASKFGKHVYKCPICDTWHLTSKRPR